jgi:hypothetical protein
MIQFVDDVCRFTHNYGRRYANNFLFYLRLSAFICVQRLFWNYPVQHTNCGMITATILLPISLQRKKTVACKIRPRITTRIISRIHHAFE